MTDIQMYLLNLRAIKDDAHKFRRHETVALLL